MAISLCSWLLQHTKSNLLTAVVCSTFSIFSVLVAIENVIAYADSIMATEKRLNMAVFLIMIPLLNSKFYFITPFDDYNWFADKIDSALLL